MSNELLDPLDVSDLSLENESWLSSGGWGRVSLRGLRMARCAAPTGNSAVVYNGDSELDPRVHGDDEYKLYYCSTVPGSAVMESALSSEVSICTMLLLLFCSQSVSLQSVKGCCSHHSNNSVDGSENNAYL